MSFRSMNTMYPNRCDDCSSSEGKMLISLLENYKRNKIIGDGTYIPNKAFNPSSIRCKRMNWFRLRGTAPDKIESPNLSLEFVANIGTHCHKELQQNLKTILGEDWISVSEYINRIHPIDRKFELVENGLETKVIFSDPPVRFSCDGIVRLNGIIYLLEIKTSESTSMRKLVCPKQEHMDQVKCYCTLLDIDNAIVLYQDRQYGKFKCFTHHVTESEKKQILDTFKDVQLHVDKNIVPEGLPIGDKWCNSNYCNYYKSCKQYGRY